LELSGTQLLAYADENINTIMKNVEALLQASREDGVEVNRETKYSFVYHHQNAELNNRQFADC
jgi:hypothetical protein